MQIASGKNKLKVRQFGVRSNEIEVKDTDVLVIKYKRWHQALFPLMIGVTFLMNVILSLPYKSKIFPIHLLFVLITFITEGFIVNKIDLN